MLKKKKLLKKKVVMIDETTPGCEIAPHLKAVLFSREWGLQVAPQQFDDRLNKRSVLYKGVK